MILAKFDFVLLFCIFQLSVAGATYFYIKTRAWSLYVLAVFINLFLFLIFVSVVIQNLIINFFISLAEVPYLTANNMILNLTLVVLDQIPELSWLRSYIYVDHNYHPLSEHNFVFGINLNNFQRMNLTYYFFLALPGIQILLAIRWVLKYHWSSIGERFYQVQKEIFLFKFFVAILLVIQVLLVVFSFLLLYSSFYLDVTSSLTLLTKKLYYIQHVLGQDYQFATRSLGLGWYNYQEYYLDLEAKHHRLTYFWLMARAFLASFGCFYFRVGVEYFVRCGETR